MMSVAGSKCDSGICTAYHGWVVEYDLSDMI